MPQGRDTEAETFSPGCVIASRYEVLEHLGTGGMGVVYRAKDRLSQRIVAVKTIRGDLDDERKQLVATLLRAEADALSRVDSDFVVRIFDAHAQLDEPPFVVMELLRGRDLERALKEDGPMTPAQALPLLWQAACGLKAIHAQAIVHRDLKPANLYIKARDDGSAELKILDFSISRLLDRASRKTTMIVGTRGYMAPEQAAGYDVDYRADLFALGQVAHAMLLGERGQSPPEGSKLPVAAFLRWHSKAIASDRRERFTSATEAIAELARALGAPLSAGSVSARSAPGLFETATTVLSTAPRRGPTVALAALGLCALGGLAFHWKTAPPTEHVMTSSSVSEPRSALRIARIPTAVIASAATAIGATVSQAATAPTASAVNQHQALTSTRRGRAVEALGRSVGPPATPAQSRRPSDEF
jgi:eukaryotic-like serine/threonine-protein kinase